MSVLSRGESSSKSYGKFTSAKAQEVLDSGWLASQKKVVEDKLVAAQKLKKQRQRDEKAAALQLQRTVSKSTLICTRSGVLDQAPLAPSGTTRN